MSQRTNRRTVLAGTAFGAGEASAQNWWPFGRSTPEAQILPAQHGGHAGHGEHGAPEAGQSAEESELIHALTHCDATGEACLTHCLTLLSQGDASMAACARSVREMRAVCGAARTLMQSRSTLAAAQLAVCRDACSACQAACRPHIDHHTQCAQCAEACAHAIAAIDALMS